MPYDPTLDKAITEKTFDSITVGIYSYNENPPKIRIIRRFRSQSDPTKLLNTKLGGMNLYEVKFIKEALEELISEFSAYFPDEDIDENEGD